MTHNVLRTTLLALTIGLPAVASAVETSAPARCDVSPQPCVSFWQRDVVLAGEGWCVVEFGFDGVGLASPVEDLTLTVRVLDQHGKDTGRGSFRLKRALGGPQASRYATARFDGLQIPGWKEIVGRDGSSPLCSPGTTLVFESATGTQSGRHVDLVPHGQLQYKDLKLLNVRVK
jgi:hypothetical protein